MNRLLALGATIACSVSSLAFARSCWNYPTLAEQKECSKDGYAIADRELNAVWPVAQAYLKSVDANPDPITRPPASATPAAQLLTIAQRAWISHRDLDCEASASSSIAPNNREVWKLECLGAKTFDRGAELRTIHADGTFLNMSGDIEAAFDEKKAKLPECDDQDSTLGWNRCLRAVHEVVGGELDTRYRILKGELAARFPGAVDPLVKSQRAWITVRDNDCEAVTREMYASSGHLNFQTFCHIRKTMERTEELLSRFFTDIR